MFQRISLGKTPISLSDLAQKVRRDKSCCIIEENGVPLAGLLGIDELEDYLELHDPAIHAQIREGYDAYRNGQARDADGFLADLSQRHPLLS